MLLRMKKKTENWSKKNIEQKVNVDHDTVDRLSNRKLTNLTGYMAEKNTWHATLTTNITTYMEIDKTC